MNIEQNVTRYAHFWTTQRDKYCLFTLNYYGRIELLIYHIPSKRVVTLPNLQLEREIVSRMLERGTKVLDDDLLVRSAQSENYRPN